MATLIVKGHGAQAVHFMEYARTLPFVEVVEDDNTPVKKFKPAVARALRKSERGEGLNYCKDAEDFFTKLGLR